MKLLSIIVPSYNMEKYLPKCLGSLVGIEKLGRGSRSTAEGSYLDLLDVIVVNDGSQDRTSEIAHDFEAKYPGVFRVIDKSNGNYGSCINAALPVAQGRFVKILDADDSYDSRYFGSFLRQLAKLADDTDMVLTDYVQVDEAGVEIARFECPVGENETFSVSDLMTREYNVSMHAVCLRTELLREIHYRQTEGISYTDSEWVYLPVAACRKIRYVKVPLYRYLIGRAGQTMEQAIWVRNRKMLETLMGRMFAQYEDFAHDSRINAAYLEVKLRLMVVMVANICVFYSPLYEVVPFFRSLRAISQRYTFAREALNQFVILEHTPIKWYYAKSLIGLPICSLIVIPLVRTYSTIVHRVRTSTAI